MSNLGMYQTITTVAKKVGGPARLLVGVAAAGYLGFRGVEAGVKKTVKTVKKANQRRSEAVQGAPLHTVKTESNCGGGLILRLGDQFRVIERDGDAVQIEIIGAGPDPYYYVSGKLLAMISDFPNNDL